jgi:hypothetical protein
MTFGGRFTRRGAALLGATGLAAALAVGLPAPASAATGQVTSIAIGTSRLITYGSVTRVSMTAFAGTAAAPNVTVQLFARAHSTGKFTLLRTLTTDAHGSASVVVAPQSFREYAYAWTNAAHTSVVVSPVEAVSVAQAVSVHTTASTVHPKQFFTLWGQTKPAEPGRSLGVQWLNQGKWQTLSATAKLVNTKLPNGQVGVGYAFSLSVANAGSLQWRTFLPAIAARGLATGYSPAITVTVS